MCVDAFEQGLYETVDTTGVARRPTTLHLRGDQGTAAVKVKLRLKGTGTFRGPAGVLAGDLGVGGEAEDADGGYVPRKAHQKAGGGSVAGRPSLKRDGAGVTIGAASRQAAVRPHKAGALAPLSGAAGAGGRKVDAVKRRSAAVTSAAGAAGSAGGGPPGYWHVGVRSDPAGQGATGGPTFFAGYRGFALGEWAPPRTVMPHHEDQALLAHEDPLQLAFGLGMRLGVTATPQSLLANARGVINAVLPSRSQIFPMDLEYVRPLLPAVFRGDVSVQRRMLVSRKLFGFSAPGLSWEGHAGSGLIEGVGAGFSRDGRGWEDVGLAAGSELLLLDGENHCAVESAPQGTSRETPSPQNSRKRLRISDDDAAVCEPAALLRPRVSRGGRLVIDRIPRSAGEGGLLLRHGAAATLLAQRKRLRVDEQHHAWSALVDVPGARGLSIDVELSSGDRVAVSAGAVACPSRMHLEHLYAYEGEATDGNSLHAHAFQGYGERVGSAPSPGTAHVEHSLFGAPVQSARGMATALLSESEYSRVGSRAGRLPASAACDADDDLLSLLPMLLPSGGADAALDALSDRLLRASTGGDEVSAGSFAFARQKRPATRVLGVSGTTGSVPSHALKTSLQRLFSSSRLPVPMQHEAFLADRLVDPSDASTSGMWQPADFDASERLAASFSIQQSRFEELWRAEDSDGEDQVASLYSSTGAYVRASHCGFAEAQARSNVASVALSEM